MPASLPFVGEIMMFAGNFPPAGWAFCDGQVLSIYDPQHPENETLFALIGTTYGGDGMTTFALPDLRGRIPIHQGTSPTIGTAYLIGQAGGQETATLIIDQIPSHAHPAQGNSNPGTQASPANGVWASSALNQYSASAANMNMNVNAITPTGGSQPHDNMMPFLTINFVIALFGIFPSR